MYVLWPGTVKIGIESQLSVVNFFPHVTMEDPPDFNHHFTEMIFGNPAVSFHGRDNYEQEHASVAKEFSVVQKIKNYFQNFIKRFQQLHSELSLNLYVSKL